MAETFWEMPMPDVRSRPEVYCEVEAMDGTDVQVEIPLYMRVLGSPVFRKIVIVVVLAAFWEIYARILDNELLMPTFLATCRALFDSFRDGVMLERTLYSLRILCTSYAYGIALAAVLAFFAATTRIGNDFLEVVTSMLNPLPAIALLPLALIWFGLGIGSVIFVVVQSVLWPVAMNTHQGFLAVSPTLRMVSANYGLSGLRHVVKILLPAALGSIITGLKLGWAFGWRTLIAAELFFGVSSGGGGIGWFIFENKNQLEIPNVYAGLLTIIIIGLIVENVIFRYIEEKTVIRWSMKH